MSTIRFLQPPSASNPARAQVIVQQANQFLKAQKGAFRLPYPASLLISNESQEKWVSYENILIASLQTGDYALAKECAEALTERFGKHNEQVIILQGMYDEATAAGEQELKAILNGYDEIIVESPTMFGVKKRRVALLKSFGRTADAITSLVEILDASPTDVEAWVELADLYQSQGALEQTIFALEEAILFMPNAWNIHAKLGEVLYLSAARNVGIDAAKLFSESTRRFCRSVELSGQYIRGYYGLKQATSKLLALSTDQTDVSIITTKTAQRLNQLATSKLAELVRRSKAHEKAWDGYNDAELHAAEALLEKSTVVR